jgi:hypothetical protein
MLRKILMASGVLITLLWVGSLGYMGYDCYRYGYDGPEYLRGKVTMEQSVTIPEWESCVTDKVWQVDGKRGARVYWNAPWLAIGLIYIGYSLSRRYRPHFFD